jgi:hypothetical protein
MIRHYIDFCIGRLDESLATKQSPRVEQNELSRLFSEQNYVLRPRYHFDFSPSALTMSPRHLFWASLLNLDCPRASSTDLFLCLLAQLDSDRFSFPPPRAHRDQFQSSTNLSFAPLEKTPRLQGPIGKSIRSHYILSGLQIRAKICNFGFGLDLRPFILRHLTKKVSFQPG